MKKRISPLLIFAGVINLTLFLIKFYIGVRTNSQCIYTDSINNLMDTLSLCLALIGVAFLNKGATKSFKFGFGRLEDFTAFIMALLMTGAGLSFAYSSLSRLMSPIPVWYFTKYALIIGCTCIFKLLLGIVFYFKEKKQPSPVLKTVMLDSFLDCGITLVALISFVLSGTAGSSVDALLGLIISIIISVSGVRLIISSTSRLIGANDSHLEKDISNIVNEICKATEFKLKDIEIHFYGKEKIFATIYLVSDAQSDDFLSINNKIKNQLSTVLNISAAVDWEVVS